MSVGAGIAIGGFGQSVGKQKLLKKFCSVVVLGEEEGKKIILNNDVSESLVLGEDGAHNPNSYGYFFILDGMNFYFETRKKIDIVSMITVSTVNIPK